MKVKEINKAKPSFYKLLNDFDEAFLGPEKDFKAYLEELFSALKKDANLYVNKEKELKTKKIEGIIKIVISALVAVACGAISIYLLNQLELSKYINYISLVGCVDTIAIGGIAGKVFLDLKGVNKELKLTRERLVK